MIDKNHPLNHEENNEKFKINVGYFHSIKITEVRGERGTGKTKLMLKSFLYDFMNNIEESSSYLVTTNQRIADYFLTSIRDMIYPLYEDNLPVLSKVEKILRSRIITLSVIDRGDRLRGLKVDNVYVDPADFMSYIEILQLLEHLNIAKVKNVNFFRTN